MNLSSQRRFTQLFFLTCFFSLMFAGAGWSKSPNEPLGDAGAAPQDATGRALNMNFETGDLTDWKVDGAAFTQQPIKGPISANRPFGEGKRSDPTGDFWIGGYEKLHDAPQGSLTSAAFKITHPFASFLIGGGGYEATRVELVDADSGQPFFTISGSNRENLVPVIVDLRQRQGQQMFVRLVDQHTGGWGHVNFDDFRFYKKRPRFAVVTLKPKPPAPKLTDLYPHAGLSAEKAAAAMKLPTGFHVTAAAAEPDVRQPIAMALDERGRVWIAEAYEYPIRAPEGKGRDRILVFEDTNQDGVLDKHTVFAEHLNLVSGLEVGFGGVWVGAAPYLLFIPDADGDDHADGPPQVLLDGWGYHDTHETLNAFIWGPDGWLYGCHGVFTHSNVGRPGAPDSQRKRINAGIWRYHPTRHEFQVFAEGTSNPWGVDFNDRGQAFCTACVIPHLYHIIQGARYQRQAGQHFNPYTFDDIKTIALHRHWVGSQWNNADRGRSNELGGGHAHAGAMIYLGGAWPAKYRDQIFMNNIHGNRINQDRLIADRSGYVGNSAPDFILTGDQWSQILNLRYGPDGQVWMIDWYDMQQCHHREIDIHDRSNGRIYRVAQDGVQPVKVDLTKQTDEQLVRHQLDQNDWYVRHARKVLQARAAAGKLSPAAREALVKILHENADDTRRLRALWALHVTGGLPESVVEGALHDDSAFVRGWTIQLLFDNPRHAVSPALLAMLRERAEQDASPVVRRYIASALQQVPLESRWEILSLLITHSEDAADHNLPLLYWYAMEPLADVDSRRALTLALAAGKHIPLLAEYMIRRIGGSDTKQALALLVEGLADVHDADVNSTATRQIFLRGITDALRGLRKVEPPAQWAAVYKKLAASDDPQLRLSAATLATTFGDANAMRHLRDVVSDAKAAAADRRRALAALVKAHDEKLADVLLSLVGRRELTSKALRALAGYADPRTPEIVLEAYASLSAAQRRDALSTLSARPDYANRLLDAIEKKEVPANHLTADLLRQLRNLDVAALNKRIEQVWGIVRDSPADKLRLIAQFKKLVQNRKLATADPVLGRAVFAKTCQQCHTLFETGGKVGPDLTGSNRANLDYLLSNVLDPSAVMAKEYQPSVLQTESGRVITGIVRRRDKNSLTIQTANEIVVLPVVEIDEEMQSPNSMMPDNLLANLSPQESRALVAYLAGGGQLPMLATPDNTATFFNGENLTGWRGNTSLWSVENGEIVGRSPGIGRNEFLISDFAVDDFDLTLEVKLSPNAGNSGIQFRCEELAGGLLKGYQADIGAGWWGKLYEEHGRALLWKQSAEKHVREGQWNTYRIRAEGSHIQTWINGHLSVDLNDPDGARRGVIGLQIHSGGPMEVRFRNLELKTLAAPEKQKGS